MANLKVNFTDDEAGSEARSFELLPTGEYEANITKVEEKIISGLDNDGREKKNDGKKYWNIEFTVQSGKYTNRKAFTNCMLFDGALYTLAQLLKATGNAKAVESGTIPGDQSFVGKSVVIVVKKQRDLYAEKRDGGGDAQWKNEVKGIKAPGNVAVASEASGSLLP